MKSKIFSALSEKPFLYAWISEIFALIATNIFNFFLLLVVFDLTHSNTATSAVVLSLTIPSIIFGVIAGAYVDRWNKKKVLLIANLSRALLLVLLAFNVSNLFFLYTVAFVFSFLTQFFIPAELPMVPLVVNKKNLYSANALFGMAIYGSLLISYIIAGPLIILLKPSGVSILLAFMLLFASLFILFIRLRNSKNLQDHKEFEKANIFRDMKHTISLISRTREVFQAIFFLALFQALVLVIATIAPGYAASVLGIPIVDLPLLFVAPAALGVVVGAGIIIHYFHKTSKDKLITIGVFLSSISLMLLPYGSKVASRDFVQTLNLYLPNYLTIDTMHIVIILAFLLGFSNSLVFVPANTILQEKTTEAFRGKVYGFLNTFVGLLAILPIIIVGSLADLIGVSVVIVGIGALLLFLGIFRLIVR